MVAVCRSRVVVTCSGAAAGRGWGASSAIERRERRGVFWFARCWCWPLVVVVAVAGMPPGPHPPSVRPPASTGGGASETESSCLNQARGQEMQGKGFVRFFFLFF